MQRTVLARSLCLSRACSLKGRSSNHLRRVTAVHHSRYVSSTCQTTAKEQPEKALVASQDSTNEPEQPEAPSKALTSPPEASQRLDKFIPVTRRSLFRALVEDQGLLSSGDRGLMENLAASLDATYSKKFYSILEQAKVCVLLCLDSY